MKITILLENTTLDNNLKFEHGLSLYVETKNHKILFDTGASDAFAYNAKQLGIDLSKVDIAFLSHGHYDHSGGLQTFLKLNNIAKVFAHKKVFGDYYAKRDENKQYIGVDKTLAKNDRFILTDGNVQLDNELELFSDVKEKKFFSTSNKALLMDVNGELVEDSFNHEQNLIISEEGKSLLIAGCAHNGIVNITNKFLDLKGKSPDFVIGGFHLFNPSSKTTETSELVESVGQALNNGKTQYYTGHCTGLEAFAQLKKVLNNNIHAISTGMIISL